MESQRPSQPGVQWLRMPLPFGLDHINLWTVRDGEGGWAAFDTGVQTPDTAAAWRTLFGAGTALAGGRLTRVFVTHMHPDHIGMAGWLAHTQVRLPALDDAARIPDLPRAGGRHRP